MSDSADGLVVEELPRSGAVPAETDNNLLGQRMRRLRRDRQLSLDQLAQMSGVSRATISKIELGQTSPGTSTLSKLTEVLGTSFAALVSPESSGEVVVLSAADQPIMRDDRTGFTRRCIAPILPSRGLDWVLNELPSEASTGMFMAHQSGVEEYIHVLSGQLKATLDNAEHLLTAGDSLYFQAHVPHQFTAIGAEPCRYMLIINNQR